MAYSGLIRRLTGSGTAHGARRPVACLVVTVLVAGLVAATALAPEPAMAQGNAPGRVQGLVEDLTESTAVDFARGQARGIAVAGEGEQARLQGQGGEFVSGAIALPFEAMHLGLHWVIRGAAPESVKVSVRTGANGQAWSDWYPTTIEAVAQLPAGQEVFAALAPGERARLAQYRVTFGSAETVGRLAVLPLITFSHISGLLP